MMFAVAACATLAGCGGGGATDARPRQEVSGTVTLDGQPLATGSIQFQPASAQEGVVAGGAHHGRQVFHPSRPGAGPRHLRGVDLVGGLGRAPPGPPGPPGPPSQGPQDLVPAKYNTQSTLTIKVEPGNAKPFDFALQK